MNKILEDFDEFIEWLKNDGLYVKSSERLWRKKIFTNLLSNHTKTLDNYQDFLTYKKLQSLNNKTIVYLQHINSKICSVDQHHLSAKLTLADGQIFTIPLKELDNFINECIKGE